MDFDNQIKGFLKALQAPQLGASVALLCGLDCALLIAKQHPALARTQRAGLSSFE
jgi:hypothetical protein